MFAAYEAATQLNDNGSIFVRWTEKLSSILFISPCSKDPLLQVNVWLDTANDALRMAGASRSVAFWRSDAGIGSSMVDGLHNKT